MSEQKSNLLLRRLNRPERVTEKVFKYKAFARNASYLIAGLMAAVPAIQGPAVNAVEATQQVIKGQSQQEKIEQIYEQGPCSYCCHHNHCKRDTESDKGENL